MAQIDTESVRLGVRLPVAAPVVGDAAKSLMGLLPLLHQRGDEHLSATRPG
jgi:pyruvate dehydrogenase (quinone)